MNKKDYKNFINSIKPRDSSYDRVKQNVMNYQEPDSDYIWFKNIKTVAACAISAVLVITVFIIFQKSNIVKSPFESEKSQDKNSVKAGDTDLAEDSSNSNNDKNSSNVSFDISASAIETQLSDSPKYMLTPSETSSISATGTPSATNIPEHKIFGNKDELYIAVKEARKEYDQTGKTTVFGLEKLSFYFDFNTIPNGFLLSSITVTQSSVSIVYSKNTDSQEVFSLTWHINQNAEEYIQNISGVLGPYRSNININGLGGLRSGEDYYWTENGFCFSADCPLSVYGENIEEVFFKIEKIDIK